MAAALAFRTLPTSVSAGQVVGPEGIEPSARGLKVVPVFVHKRPGASEPLPCNASDLGNRPQTSTGVRHDGCCDGCRTTVPTPTYRGPMTDRSNPQTADSDSAAPAAGDEVLAALVDVLATAASIHPRPMALGEELERDARAVLDRWHLVPREGEERTEWGNWDPAMNYVQRVHSEGMAREWASEHPDWPAMCRAVRTVPDGHCGTWVHTGPWEPVR